MPVSRIGRIYEVEKVPRVGHIVEVELRRKTYGCTGKGKADLPKDK